MCAMKVIKRNRQRSPVAENQDAAQKQAGYEMDILKDMVHVNMTPLYEIIDDPNSDKIFIIMKYLSTGNLEQKLE